MNNKNTITLLKGQSCTYKTSFALSYIAEQITDKDDVIIFDPEIGMKDDWIRAVSSGKITKRNYKYYVPESNVMCIDIIEKLIEEKRKYRPDNKMFVLMDSIGLLMNNNMQKFREKLMYIKPLLIQNNVEIIMTQHVPNAIMTTFKVIRPIEFYEYASFVLDRIIDIQFSGIYDDGRVIYPRKLNVYNSNFLNSKILKYAIS